jgi:predicted Zn-dependent protease
MIGDRIADLAARVAAADGVHLTDETVTVTVDSNGETIAADRSDSVHLRVFHEGRMGWAAGAADRAAAVAEAAIESARAGDPIDLILPAPSPSTPLEPPGPPSGSTELLALARELRDRLAADGRTIEAWAESSTGKVQVANGRGVDHGYRTGLVGLGVMVLPRSGPRLRLHLSETARPDAAALEALAREAEHLLAPPVIESPELSAAVRVRFGPRAVRGLLRPVLARLARPRPELPRLDERFTVIDDPLAAGRPGSRPIDDDGVVTRRVTLIDRGRAVRGIVDLSTAARERIPATGHGWRRGPAPPRAGFSNLVLEPGQADEAALQSLLTDGLIVDDLQWGPAPNPDGGLFRIRIARSRVVRGGEVIGQAHGLELAGSVFRLLDRVVAIGADARWIGAARFPSLIVDGVAVRRQPALASSSASSSS